MKIVPNIFSILRIVLSTMLILLAPFSDLFWIIYFTCGVSDILDGYIARKTNSASKLGALLDSIADIIFMGIAGIIILPRIFIPAKICIWIILIAFVRIISLVIGYFKYHAFAILHTYTNKVTGLLLFIFPFLYKPINSSVLEYIICIVSSIATIEELAINIKSSKLSKDVIGIFVNKHGSLK